MNWEKRGFTFEAFEKVLSKELHFEKLGEGCYMINGGGHDTGEKVVPQKSFAMIPYCLKPLHCKARLDHDCHDFDQDLCRDCIVRELIAYYESRGIPYYHVVRDDDDIPRALRLYTKDHGDFQAVIVVSCPRAVLVNTRFVHRHNVPVIFISLMGWEGCEIHKALQGKWWGETSLDMNRVKEALDVRFQNVRHRRQARLRRDLHQRCRCPLGAHGGHGHHRNVRVDER